MTTCRTNFVYCLQLFARFLTENLLCMHFALPISNSQHKFSFKCLKYFRLKPINSDTTRCTSSGNSSPPTNKTSRSSERQLRPLRNLCDESELSRSIMPSSSSDQEPDERTLNDESPFLK
uniref:Secreted protein n=1 Tax=Parascaris univalens TaxID=6257 RepID=A0A915ATC0_PARUN